jgi:hypothetical protein
MVVVINLVGAVSLVARSLGSMRAPMERGSGMESAQWAFLLIMLVFEICWCLIIILLNGQRLDAELRASKAELNATVSYLEQALASVKTLNGLLPICSSCKKVRDDTGYWSQIETYVSSHSDAEFSHGLCPECARKLYPNLTP